MTAYYNEIEPEKAEWLRELIRRDLIAPGEVDERSIKEVQPEEIARFTQCHFFAGIGVWSYALRLAGWDDARPVWTGSCPCQPFSDAGEGGGFDDERHLWPDWFRLIRERRPDVFFGEQVATKRGLAWLDLVCADVEGAGYAIAPADLCAASVGAPQIRQRIYFVADTTRARSTVGVSGSELGEERNAEVAHHGGGGESGAQRRSESSRGMGNTDQGRGGWNSGEIPRTQTSVAARESVRRVVDRAEPSGPVGGFWAGAEWLPCRDGKARPVEPGTSPLAYGTPERVVRVRGYGDAIVAPLAAEFITAYRQVIE